ncbi:MAG TPA: hypothetical protein VNI77_05965 [Nitrososphaera sp.]|nr:hypothetical protein [Nitrososphaera sp.]
MLNTIAVALKRLAFRVFRKAKQPEKRTQNASSGNSSIPFQLIDNPETALGGQELYAIGRITVQMAALELDLIRFLSALMFKNPDAGIAVFLGINLKSLIEMLLPAFRLKVKSEAFDDDIVSLVSALDKLAAERNAIVHGQWHYDPLQQRPMRAKTRKGKPKDKEQLHYFQTEKTSAYALHQFADLLVLARKVVVRFYQKLLRESLIAG